MDILSGEWEEKVKLGKEKQEREKQKWEAQEKAEKERQAKERADNERIEEDQRKKSVILKTYTNSLGMEFILIPTGEFMMGAVYKISSIGENHLKWNGKNWVRTTLPDIIVSQDQKPQHKVKITKPFYIGKYPVTQEEWRRVMGINPSSFKNPGKSAPVECITWNDCLDFIERLNRREGKTYKLPKEAEWEYAAKSGGSGIYTLGDNDSKLGEYSWYCKNSNKITHLVGEKLPNSWGLYDMIGNVWEWCEDWYFKNSPMDNPKELEKSEGRVLRGGSWSSKAEHCSVSIRGVGNPDFGSIDAGFRLVLLP